MKQSLTQYFLLMTCLWGTMACSSKPYVHEFSDLASPNEEISKLEKDLNYAKKRNVNILSPKNYQFAEDSLEDSKYKYLHGKNNQQILHQVALGRAYLVSANTSAEIARDSLENIMSAREFALKANAPTSFKREFVSADNHFMAITKDIEKNKMSSLLKDRAILQEKYLNLEIKAVQVSQLNESQKIINQAKSENAETYAPRSLAIAQKKYDDTAAFIRSNPRNEFEIKSRAKKALESAVKAYNINRTAKGAAKISPEEIALMLQSEKDRTNKNKKEVIMVKDELRLLQSSLQKEQLTNDTLNISKKELEVVNKKLEMEKRFNQKFDYASKNLAGDETEFFRQGNDLIIRLKGMQFKPANSTIQNKNFSLLNKVEKIVKEFGNGTSVIIEGHTDSMGTKNLNNRISLERATMVKDYLQPSFKDLAIKIETIGYGDEKPVATNKTDIGRAQNRRVDLIIRQDPAKL